MNEKQTTPSTDKVVARRKSSTIRMELDALLARRQTRPSDFLALTGADEIARLKKQITCLEEAYGTMRDTMKDAIGQQISQHDLKTKAQEIEDLKGRVGRIENDITLQPEIINLDREHREAVHAEEIDRLACQIGLRDFVFVPPVRVDTDLKVKTEGIAGEILNRADKLLSNANAVLSAAASKLGPLYSAVESSASAVFDCSRTTSDALTALRKARVELVDGLKELVSSAAVALDAAARADIVALASRFNDSLEEEALAVAKSVCHKAIEIGMPVASAEANAAGSPLVANVRRKMARLSSVEKFNEEMLSEIVRVGHDARAVIQSELDTLV